MPPPSSLGDSQVRIANLESFAMLQADGDGAGFLYRQAAKHVAQFDAWSRLPNLHISLHHSETAQEYSDAKMAFTLQERINTGGGRLYSGQAPPLNSQWINLIKDYIMVSNHRSSACYLPNVPLTSTNLQQIFNMVYELRPSLARYINPNQKKAKRRIGERRAPIKGDEEHSHSLTLRGFEITSPIRNTQGGDFYVSYGSTSRAKTHVSLARYRYLFSRL
jgi:hypothetical protein